MNITVTDREPCTKQVKVAIPSEAVRAETDKVAAKLAKQVNVPGFRRGHVPTSVVKTRFRKELRDEVVSHILPHALGNAIKEKDLKVVGEPSLDEFQFNDDESIDATFTLQVAPEFTLANYRTIPLRKRSYKVTEDDIKRTLESLRERHAELIPVEDRAAQSGDLVTIKIAGKIVPSSGQSATDEAEGSELEEIKEEELEFEVGGKAVLDEFNQAIAGASVGDQRSFSVDYPADYKSEKLAGRKVDYSAEVTVIRQKELPALDDDFAKSIGEQYQTLAELREQVQSNYEKEAVLRSEAELRNAAMDQLIDRNRFDVPPSIVEKQMDSRINSVVRRFAAQGVDPRKLDIDWEEVRESQRDRAEREVRGSFILNTIAEAEGIEVTDQELSQEIEQLSKSSGQSADAIRARLTKEGTLDSIREQVRNRKALDFVIASADIRTEEVQGLSAEDAADGERESS